MGWIRFGHRLGDMIYHPLIYLGILLSLINFALFRKKQNNVVYLSTALLTSFFVLIFLKMTIWRGPEYSWNGDILALSSATKEKRKEQDTSTYVTEVVETEEESDSWEWVKKNRIPQNDMLVDFDYEYLEEACEYGKINSKISGDTIIVSFCTEMPVGCWLIGDVKINKKNVELLIGQGCPPDGEAIVEEIADLKFTFKIQNEDEIRNKPFVIREHAGLLKK